MNHGGVCVQRSAMKREASPITLRTAIARMVAGALAQRLPWIQLGDDLPGHA